MDHYEEGREARRRFLQSDQFKPFHQDMPGRDAMRLFLPCVPQDMIQVARPLPPRWGEWVRGWDNERAAE